MDLDEAESKLDSAGLDHNAKGGGMFGIVVKSNWTVCKQRPAAGVKASSVILTVARSCSGTGSSVTAQVSTGECWLAMQNLYDAANKTDGDPGVGAYFPTIRNCKDVGDWVASAKKASIRMNRSDAVSLINSACSLGFERDRQLAICEEAQILARG